MAAMASDEPRFTPEEVGRLGEEIYEKKLKAILDPAEKGRVIAIDVLSGDYALADSILEASDAIRAQHTNPVVYFMRVGERVMKRM